LDDLSRSARFDHCDGDIVDGQRRHRGLGFRREWRRHQGDVPEPREEGRHGWLRELHVVADEHEQDVGHGRPDVGVLLHAEQADVVAPPRLVLGVGSPQRRVHELARAIFTPQLPCLSSTDIYIYIYIYSLVNNSVQITEMDVGSEWYGRVHLG